MVYHYSQESIILTICLVCVPKQKSLHTVFTYSGISNNMIILNGMHYNCKETIQALIITTKFRRCKILVIIYAQNALKSWEAGVGMKEEHSSCMKSTLSPRAGFSLGHVEFGHFSFL